MRGWIAGISIGIAAILLFARLGHYALWDDEAITAITAHGVWETGDTSAVQGENILLYRNGLIVRNFKDRASPPLQFYVDAPFVGLLGNTSLAARLPFAMLGIACVCLIFYWLKKSNADTITWLLTALAILGNVSLMLYFRQCRYYGLTMFLAVATAYTYLHATRRNQIFLSILLLLLLAANYMTFAAVIVAMAIDYLIWQRRFEYITLRHWILIALPSILIGGAIVWVWNPLRIAEPAPATSHTWLGERLILLWWNLRDLDACEFGSGIVLLASPLLYFVRRNVWFLRSFVALMICVVVISFASPQHPGQTAVADVRYLCALIPLCIAIAVLALREIAQISVAAAVITAALAFFTNAFNISIFLSQPLHCTPYLFALELLRPPPEPITPVAQWINENVNPRESIVVLPQYLMYPLMFHAPQAIYAWQLNPALRSDYPALPSIHFATAAPPEYVIRFDERAPDLQQFQLRAPLPEEYHRVARLNVWGHDAFRPELFLRTFTPVEFDAETQGVLIFKRDDLPLSTPLAP